MKILIFGLLGTVGLALVALQHQQLGRLRAENATLASAAAEANQLKADLAQSSGTEAQDADEIARLREENHDLLKLRNEVNQLRDARAQFEKVSAENQRLQAQVRTAANSNAKQAPMQPILIRVESLYDRGLSTPENAVQTILWAERSGNVEELSRCVTPKRWSQVYDSVPEQDRQRFIDNLRHNLDQIISIEIVARRELDATTVQLGIQVHRRDDPKSDMKGAFTLVLERGEWKMPDGP
jgi:uncharacterized protein YdcH (DUF465 family)